MKISGTGMECPGRVAGAVRVCAQKNTQVRVSTVSLSLLFYTLRRLPVRPRFLFAPIRVFRGQSSFVLHALRALRGCW